MSFANTSGVSLNVKAEHPDLLPEQQKQQYNFLRSSNAYVRRFIKHPKLSYFHSYPELLHAALLESDPQVVSFTPQPFRLRIGRKRYTPDCFVLRGNKKQVIELKPKGEMDFAVVRSLKDFFATRNMEFLVLANEELLSQQALAENWLVILQNLILHRDLDSEARETQILGAIGLRAEVQLGELISTTRVGFNMGLLAIHRLLHRGILYADLADAPLHSETLVRAC